MAPFTSKKKISKKSSNSICNKENINVNLFLPWWWPTIMMRVVILYIIWMGRWLRSWVSEGRKNYTINLSLDDIWRRSYTKSRKLSRYLPTTTTTLWLDSDAECWLLSGVKLKSPFRDLLFSSPPVDIYIFFFAVA